MAGVTLRDYQLDAIKRMKTGCILCGGVGSGKSLTSIAYYYVRNGGIIGTDLYEPMDDPPKNLYIITTARKRDTCEWDGELAPFLLSTHDDMNLYSNKVIVDSWNNVKKYSDVKDAFFIFDEQRVVGSGTWVKAFLKIAKSNEWILLSATPGDTWQDYIPVFVANGFYKNRSEFTREHIVYSRFSKFPKIDRYLNTERLTRLRNKILVNMDFKRQTVSHHEDIYVGWAAQPKSGQNYLVKLLYERNGYNSKGVTYDADTINLGCDIDMHYYKLKNVSWENGGGITGTMRFVQVGGMNSDGTVSNWSNNAYLQFERGVLIKAGWYDY